MTWQEVALQLGTLSISGYVAYRMKQLERNTNSKMDLLLHTTGDAKKAEGNLEGRRDLRHEQAVISQDASALQLEQTRLQLIEKGRDLEKPVPVVKIEAEQVVVNDPK